MKTLKRWLSGLFGALSGGPNSKGFKAASHLAEKALPYVELVAKLTPTRADDEIFALARRFGLFADEGRTMTPADKEHLLFDAAVAAMKKKLDTSGVPDSVVDLAVQAAYTAFREFERNRQEGAR